MFGGLQPGCLWWIIRVKGTVGGYYVKRGGVFTEWPLQLALQCLHKPLRVLTEHYNKRDFTL